MGHFPPGNTLAFRPPHLPVSARRCASARRIGNFLWSQHAIPCHTTRTPTSPWVPKGAAPMAAQNTATTDATQAGPSHSPTGRQWLALSVLVLSQLAVWLDN